MPVSQSHSNDSPIHLAITLRVREGRESEFAAALSQFARRSLEHRGTTGVHLIYPVPGTGCRDFGVLRSFESERYSEEFYHSDMYQQYKSETAHLVEEAPSIRRLEGLESFLRNDGRPSPVRWKMAVITYLGVVPSVIFWSSTLRPLLGAYHWLLGVLTINAAVVATLAWVMMPALTKLFRNWLHRV
ncbi:hypothetical protein VN12_05270 [Pirellula sp. SH-Sr6A]|uniref:antibiotic biosynthesis monooxygenase n=1 Tax=Pirellula sp. SH-Sr6A TaxID=1632865 RepID=UPI00078DF3A3|nr:antibiotic biosynthesis monooxygenase [Pirellula sp. SH-Sr6A]AMV31507.1 hypothetical protein VN12_05270 [Pirellula sp. SH-Sr6A]